MKKLVLKYIETVAEYGQVSFKIEEQTDRNQNFGINNFNHFNASNNIKLTSVSFPAVYLYSSTFDPVSFCCRGDNAVNDHDNIIIKVAPDVWEKIKVAVKEYNEYFGNYGECILGEVIEDIVPMDMFIIE